MLKSCPRLCKRYKEESLVHESRNPYGRSAIRVKDEEKPLPHNLRLKSLEEPKKAPTQPNGRGRWSYLKKHNRLEKKIRDANHEYIRLNLQFEGELIKHKLAFRYFDFRSFYFVFLPVTLIASLITIIGFLIYGNEDDNDVQSDSLLTSNTKQILSVVVGILGAISTLINSIGKRTNYQSQADMHKSAVKALEKICLKVEFEREWFERNAQISSLKGEKNKLTPDLKTHQASFKAMLDACCDSPVPYRVEQAFTVLEQVYTRQEFGPGRVGQLSNRDNALKYYYHKLWKEHSTYWLWPLKAPTLKVSTKYKEWKKEIVENKKP